MAGGTRRRRVLLVATGLVVMWVVLATWLLAGARSTARSGASALRGIRREATIASLLKPATRRDLDRAGGDFDRAASRLDNPLLWPLRAMPVLSRHVGAARQGVEAARDGVAVADDALGSLRGLVAREHVQGAQRLALLRDLAVTARRTDRALADLELPSARSLASPVGGPIGELAVQRARARTGARRLAAVSDALAQVIAGPDPYLLLGANNAEMRTGSGMFLSATTLRFGRGTLDLDEVQPTANVVLASRSVPVGGDLGRNWPWLDPGRDLRNVGLSADFPQVAPVATANWARVPGGARTAGAVVVDVDGIRALLRAVGPIEVDGVRYTAANVRGELLRNQYRLFEGDRVDRRDQLGQVARATFERLEKGRSWKVEDLASALVDAVQGRHLLVWSRDRDLARVWRDAGADGHLDGRSLSLAVMNRGAEKLDSWLATEAVVTGRRLADDRVRIDVRYRISNRAPAEGPGYLVGPNVTGLSAGDHRGLVVVNVPGGSRQVTLAGARQFLAAGDGPTEVVAGEVTVRRGQTVTVTVAATLPPGVEQVVLEPSARIPATRWRVDGHTVPGSRRRTVTPGRTNDPP